MKSNIQQTILDVKRSEFIRHSNMAMGYVPGFPLLCVMNGYLCARIPFVRYQVTSATDQTLVYPPRYMATVKVPEGVIVGYEDLMFNPLFQQTDFSQPVGLFRHEAIKMLNKEEYERARKVLFERYDELIDGLSEGQYDSANDTELAAALQQLAEPSLKPFYRSLEPNFYNKYMKGDE